MRRSEASAIVVGAGLSGLAAASALQRGGLQVRVVEARDRVGGRIWTSRAWPDLPIDLGASWIHGVDSNPVTELAEQAGARYVRTRYGSSLWFGRDGRRLEVDGDLAESEDMLERIRAEIDDAASDLSLAQAVRGSQLWARSDASRRAMLRKWINTAVEHEYAADWEHISAWYFDEDGDDLPGGDALFPEGFDQIVGPLAEGLSIRTGDAVRRIARTTDGATVHLADGSALSADHVVVTVPLGVLQSGGIEFSEPLADERQRAIGTLRAGLLNKCCLRFDRVAWPSESDWLQWLGPREGFWVEWVDLAHCAGLPVLMGFNAGAQAGEVERLDDRDTVASAHEALVAMFGSDFPAPRDGLVTRWGHDRHALGSYSYNAVGTQPDTRKELAGTDWDGVLAFAGEAASNHDFGSAHGAIHSGREVARQLLNGYT